MGTPAAEAALICGNKPPIVAAPQSETAWKAELRTALRSSAALRAACALPAAPETTVDFPVLAPWPLVRRIQPGNPQDPILLQLLSQPAELQASPGFSDDPLAEADSTQAPGLIQKYAGRALLISTGACALHCRYCFRRAFPYSSHAQGRLRPALEQLASSPEVGEVILSGGDPLSLDDDRLEALLEELDAIPQLHTLRLHTRFPIAIPQRVTPRLLQVLEGSRLQCISVVHSNHAQELDTDTDTALRALGSVGPVLNQSVLLAGINDSAEALVQLSRRLWQAGVLPYYLHQMDRVQGAAHFVVSDARAQELHALMRAQLPGYLLPRLVREVPGASAKQALGNCE